MNDNKSCSNTRCQDVYWWAMLTVAVLAVPSVGFMVASAITMSGVAGIAVFMASCWVCTYLGMRLMAKSQSKK